MGNAGAPIKKGIEYYSIDMNSSIRDELTLQFGDSGIRIWLNLQDNIYKNEGYYSKWGEPTLKRFARDFYIDSSNYQLINDIVLFLLDYGFFDQEIYNKHSILTSKDIQRFFFWVTRKRTAVDIINEFIHPELTAFLQEIEEKREKIVEKRKNRKKGQEEEGDQEEFIPATNVIVAGNNSDRSGNNKDTVRKESELLPETIQNNAGNNSDNFHPQPELSKETISNVSDDNNIKYSKEKESKEKRSEASILNSSNSVSKDTVKSSEGSGKGKKKTVHPARENIIAKWESAFEMVYTPTRDANIAINHIIKSLENNLKKGGIPEDLLVNEIVNTWERILKKWDKLEPFYSKQVTFEAIAKYFVTIVKQLFPGGKQASAGSEKSNVSGGYD